MFPLELPFATQFYLDLYVVTFVVHLLLMFYVFAGTFHLAVFGDAESTTAAGRINETVRDWLPFALSAAITAGIAPLLFIQLLYQFDYYTANVLLSHRWMSILPILIVAFYGLYLLKMKLFVKTRPWLDRLIACFVFLCILYVGYTFSENHLLSVQSKTVWASHYASGRIFYWTSEILPRVATILGQAFSSTAIVWYWQISMQQRQKQQEIPQELPRRLAYLSTIGLIISLVAFIYYCLAVSKNWYPGNSTDEASQLLKQPYIYLYVCGLLFQIWWWSTITIDPQRISFASWFLAGSSALTLLMGAMVREQYRVSRIVTDNLLQLHQHHLMAEGKWLFLAFTIINTLLICWLIYVTRKAIHASVQQTKR